MERGVPGSPAVISVYWRCNSWCEQPSRIASVVRPGQTSDQGAASFSTLASTAASSAIPQGDNGRFTKNRPCLV